MKKKILKFEISIEIRKTFLNVFLLFMKWYFVIFWSAASSLIAVGDYSALT